jgi:hypothetical protein
MFLTFARLRDGWDRMHSVRVDLLSPVPSYRPILMSRLPLHVPDLRLVYNDRDITDGDTFSSLSHEPESAISIYTALDDPELSASSLAGLLRQCGFDSIHADLVLPANRYELLETLARNQIAIFLSANDTKPLDPPGDIEPIQLIIVELTKRDSPPSDSDQ